MREPKQMAITFKQELEFTVVVDATTLKDGHEQFWEWYNKVEARYPDGIPKCEFDMYAIGKPVLIKADGI